jgi:hypothetical protein
MSKLRLSTDLDQPLRIAQPDGVLCVQLVYQVDDYLHIHGSGVRRGTAGSASVVAFVVSDLQKAGGGGWVALYDIGRGRSSRQSLPGSDPEWIGSGRLGARKTIVGLRHGHVVILGRAMNLSARAYHRVLKLARTIAYLAGSERIQPAHIAEAIADRPRSSIDRGGWSRWWYNVHDVEMCRPLPVKSRGVKST